MKTKENALIIDSVKFLKALTNGCSRRLVINRILANFTNFVIEIVAGMAIASSCE